MKKIIIVFLLMVSLAIPSFSATIDMTSAIRNNSFGGVVLLNGVSSTGDSDVLALPYPISAFTINITLAGGTVSALSTTLQGSIDGTNWATLVTFTNTSGEMAHVVNKPVLFVKVNLGTRTVATGTPLVTVTLAGSKGL